MKRILSLVAAISLSIAGFAQVDAKAGKEIVDKLCGCFEVSFKYAETFAPSADYKFHDRDETGGIAEMALPIEVTDKKVVIQHLLIVSPKMVVKHWREVWTYENQDFWKYNGDRVWEKYQLPYEKVKGTWTQAVWEVGEEPRYQGNSVFVPLDGKMVWQNTTDAPLPRREYSVRSDYNILKRTNRLSITDTGYLHEQDNQKIIRGNGMDQLLVEEKGWNTYKKIPEKDCTAALKYWEENKGFWSKVREEWNRYINNNTVISILNKIDGKMLNENLFAMAKEYADKKIGENELSEKIKAELSRYLNKKDTDVATK